MILHNINTCWISMLSPLKHILFKYQPFFIEMAFNSPIIPMVASILDLLCDVEIMLFILCFVPMLEILKLWWNLFDCAILWQQWNFAKMIFTNFMLIQFQLSIIYFVAFMGSQPLFMRRCAWNGSLSQTWELIT
jgi:hypothetical protein